MLRSYLASAELDLKAKQELIDVKHQRLHIAQDEYQQLNNTLTTLSASNTSCKSSTYWSGLPTSPIWSLKLRESWQHSNHRKLKTLIKYMWPFPKAPQIASPPLLHTGRMLVSSCVHPVPLRPKVGQTLPTLALPSGRQCHSAVTSPTTSGSDKKCSFNMRPASAIPGFEKSLKSCY